MSNQNDNKDQLPATNDKKHHVRVSFSSETYQRVLKLKQRFNLRSIPQMVRNAIRLYEWYLDTKGQGWTITITRGNESVSVDFQDLESQ